jgi:exo-beta-1,3-glucanase (GH17 family)
MPVPTRPSAATSPARRPARRWRGALAYCVALLPLLAYWWWQGRLVDVVDAPSARVPCVSYAPYQGDQTPFDEGLIVPPQQIAADIARLAGFTDCVRTYSVDQGLAALPAIAKAHGMQVMLGAWIGRERAKNETELATVIDLANRYPETIRAVIVGNEVLLRKEQPPAELAAMIERVRAAVPTPVTYADVWEFWEKHPEIAGAVDFVTIHTLPYWEDDPKAIDAAIAHALAIWRTISARFPGKPVFIGEAGWPSAGRMREGALPSPVNQARFVRELMVEARAAGIGLNLIEAFDQPWKRKLEGTVGGHWGLFDADREQKFALSGPVSADPGWLAHFGQAAALGLLLLAPALVTGRRASALGWLGLALGAAAGGALLCQGLIDGVTGALTLYDWLVLAVRTLLAMAAAMLVLDTLPLVVAGTPEAPLPIAALDVAARARRLPGRPWRETALGLVRAVALFETAATTLCLLFDPRYRDFASALHAVPAAAFLALALAQRHAGAGVAGGVAGDLAEERLLAAFAAVGGIGVMLNEGLANHQALAWTAVSLLFAAAIAVERHGQGTRAAPYRLSSASAPSSTPPAAGSGT